MTDFDATKLDWVSGLLAGWTYDKEVNKWFQGAFRHAHRLTRPCPTCSGVIVLDVTTKALEGKATNHGLALRRCKACRKALKAGPQAYAERKAAVAEAHPEPPTAAPVQSAVVAVAAGMSQISTAELEMLRTANITMKEELDGLYMQLRELRGHPASAPAPIVKAPESVRTYKLPEDRSLGAAVIATTKAAAAHKAREELLQKWLEKNPHAAKNNSKMPWEGA